MCVPGVGGGRWVVEWGVVQVCIVKHNRIDNNNNNNNNNTQKQQ